jgi:hypothetical protein
MGSPPEIMVITDICHIQGHGDRTHQQPLPGASFRMASPEPITLGSGSGIGHGIVSRRVFVTSMP